MLYLNADIYDGVAVCRNFVSDYPYLICKTKKSLVIYLSPKLSPDDEKRIIEKIRHDLLNNKGG